jgi:hypothetical protein
MKLSKDKRNLVDYRSKGDGAAAFILPRVDSI